MTNTGYPYEGFEDMFPNTEPTPEWYGHGHKHFRYNKTPMQRLLLVDGQRRDVIDVTDPDEPLDHVVADELRGQPAERAHFPVSTILTIIPTQRPGARPDMESGQFQLPDTRPGLLVHHRRGRR